MQRSPARGPILAISTSTPRGSVALVAEDRLLAECVYEAETGHAERLFGMIDAALAKASIDRSALAAIAVDVGPGSFTGIRVGVASAKGIALGLGLPLVGTGSLEAMAFAASQLGLAKAGADLVASIDAKKSEIFFASFDDRGAPKVDAEHASIEEFSARVLASNARVLGDVASMIPSLSERLVRHPSTDRPDAAFVARAAAFKLEAGGDFDPARALPVYVRAPDAKLMGS